MNDEQIKTSYIPMNFQTGINVLGKSYSIINLIEGGILFAIFGIGTFVLLNNFNLDTSTVIGISLSIGLPLGILGVVGLNNEPLHVYIANVIKFIKNKRIAYYNPKVKTKAKPIDYNSAEEQVDLLPRDKVIAYYEKFKETMDEKNRNKMLENESANEENEEIIHFEDDEDIEEIINKNKRKRG